uniref:Uncharacterized protein n=1 Tax=Arion vulgaris TaxID=1028688 RepID=A0A0B6ZCL6_9EUPU
MEIKFRITTSSNVQVFCCWDFQQTMRDEHIESQIAEVVILTNLLETKMFLIKWSKDTISLQTL